MSPGPGETREDSKIIIVGGGIAGLFCAKRLSDRGFVGIRVLELKETFGGRIETGDLDGFTVGGTRPLFKAEFGPMRFELSIEPLFDQLCRDLGIRSRFKNFSPATPGKSPIDYPLFQDERRPNGTALDALDLLRLGVYRMLGRDTKTLENVGDVLPVDEAWLDSIGDHNGPSSFDQLRKTATFKGKFGGRLLYEMGFWNALQAVLSPGAVLKILNQGTFYHLMPENPNAVEWSIFWLRLFKDSQLFHLPEGVRCITEEMTRELKALPSSVVRLETSQQVVALALSENPERLIIHAVDHTKDPPADIMIEADHVFLALPKQPLLRLTSSFPLEIQHCVESVIAFPLLKVFVTILTPPWWEQLPLVQEGAWLVPTREVHWIKEEGTQEDVLSHNTMALLYTDRPGTSFWRQLLMDPDHHDRAERGKNPELERTLLSWLVDFHREWAKTRLPPSERADKKWDPSDPVITILRDLMRDVPGISGLLPATWSLSQIWGDPDWLARVTYQSICDYAIRDWAQEPFGAGCHAWAPGTRSWEIRDKLRAFNLLDGKGPGNVHICGEAYSDYQGFIEGALRSATDAMDSLTSVSRP
jgi:hypothetical protein